MSRWRSSKREDTELRLVASDDSPRCGPGRRPRQSTTRPIHSRRGRRTSETAARSRLGACPPASALRSRDRTGVVTREAARRVMTSTSTPRRGRRGARDCRKRDHRALVDGGEARLQRRLARGSALARRRLGSQIERSNGRGDERSSRATGDDVGRHATPRPARRERPSPTRLLRTRRGRCTIKTTARSRPGARLPLLSCWARVSKRGDGRYNRREA